MALQLQPRQTQKQAMTPAMWLGLNLLTLPIGELREAVKKELDSNPALEVEVPSSYAGARHPRPDGGGDERSVLENVADESGERLDEHLMSELRMAGIEGRELELCRAIVAEIDGDGRFTGSVPDLQIVTGATADELEAARQKVMSIDPKGCGARDIRECYLAQLGQVPAAKRKAVEQGVDAIVEMLAGKTPKEQIAPDVLKLLKGLDPYPGRQYEYRTTEFVTPDIRVDEDGEVEVDKRDIPELRVSPKYVELAKDKSQDEETRTFAAERVKRAREFREAVIKRQETIEKIAEFAISGQSDFLKKGTAGLHKQTMSEIAKAAKCTVATVSRAAARKYVKTPRGTVPLRKFFALVDQGPIERLREILAAIPRGTKVSDREISERMAQAGFPMARRTVAKYRAGFLV